LDDFINLLPDMIVSDTLGLPRTKQEAVSRINQFCPCYLFCWSHEEAAWPLAVDFIIPIIRNGIDGYMTKYPYDEKAALEKQRLISNSSSLVSLPLVPNITIHYRCSDTLRDSEYGFLPYLAFDKILTPFLSTSSSSKLCETFIYIISDHPDRGTDREECRILLEGLKSHIVKLVPQAKVVIKRGDSILLDMARISLSKLTVCSGSTFCMWPAIANSKGTVHMPLNAPVAGLRGAVLNPKRFKWITDCGMLHFTNETIDVIIKKIKAPCVPLPQSDIDDIVNMRAEAQRKKNSFA
jgi:hypothetical protein